MHKLATLFILLLFNIYSSFYCTHASIECARPIQQIGEIIHIPFKNFSDKESYISELRITTVDLLHKYPNSDRLIIFHNYFSMQCQILRDSTSLSDTQKIDLLKKTEDLISDTIGHSYPTETRSRPGCSTESAAIEAPIRTLFNAIVNKDIDQYMSVWTSNAIQRTRSQTRQIRDIAHKRGTDFTYNIQKVEIYHLKPTIKYTDSLKSKIDNIYTMTFFYKNGKIIRETNISESYTLECDNGSKWLIRENNDYLSIYSIERL